MRECFCFVYSSKFLSHFLSTPNFCFVNFVLGIYSCSSIENFASVIRLTKIACPVHRERCLLSSSSYCRHYYIIAISVQNSFVWCFSKVITKEFFFWITRFSILLSAAEIGRYKHISEFNITRRVSWLTITNWNCSVVKFQEEKLTPLKSSSVKKKTIFVLVTYNLNKAVLRWFRFSAIVSLLSAVNYWKYTHISEGLNLFKLESKVERYQRYYSVGLLQSPKL